LNSAHDLISDILLTLKINIFSIHIQFHYSKKMHILKQIVWHSRECNNLIGPQVATVFLFMKSAHFGHVTDVWAETWQL